MREVLARRLLPAFGLGLGLVGLGLVAGCGALDVSDPTRIEEADISNAAGADLLRKDALAALAAAVGTGTLTSGLLTDEFLWDPNPSSTSAVSSDVLDRRESLRYEELAHPAVSGYQQWQAVRLAAAAALPKLRTYMPEPARSAYLGQMLAVRGLATLHLAEHFCPGLPLHEVIDYKLIAGPPRPTVEVFEQALIDLDSAVVVATDSARFLDLARVGRARALLGLGRWAEAAAAAHDVPTSYVWRAEFGTGTGNHQLVFTRTATNSRRSVANREGGAGLDYILAKDPRVKTDSLGLAYDGVTQIRAINKYPTTSAPIVVANGIEARLIEAEAALRANPDDPQWLAILNELRRNWVTPALADTTDPGTAAARVDLLFRERAFWLFATGHRLGDLRRLIAHYGRPAESVFPSGAYRLGGLYGTGTSLPFPALLEAAYNPAVTGCTSR